MVIRSLCSWKIEPNISPWVICGISPLSRGRGRAKPTQATLLQASSISSLFGIMCIGCFPAIEVKKMNLAGHFLVIVTEQF